MPDKKPIPDDTYPTPRTPIPLMAPNMQSEVQRTINEHPEIDTMDDVARGEIIDITDWRINGGLDRPWGRKARSNNPSNPNLNTDGMTYLRPDSLFEIYDCISGIDGESSWEGYGPYAQGENGFWWPPQETEHMPTPGPSPTPEKDAEQDARISTLENRVGDLEIAVSELNQKLLQPLHAHGPVDLPIVLESLTRMRAKGDIDVEVKVGEATEPTATDAQVTAADIAALKKLIKG